MLDCTCLEEGPRHPDVVDERCVGCDETEGRFANVRVTRCVRCRRLWLRHQVEREFYTAATRWAEAPIGEEEAATRVRGDSSRRERQDPRRRS